jgi:hypothetical protein
MPNHRHSLNTEATTPGGGLAISGGTYFNASWTGYTGGDGPHNNIQPTIVGRILVKVK